MTCRFGLDDLPFHEDVDPALLSAALGDVARARGMTRLARETGITRDGLYEALSPTGNPSFVTFRRSLGPSAARST